MAFCLSYGRLLAQRTRCLEYNYACAHLKNDLTPTDVATKSNHWIFKSDTRINYAKNVRGQAKKAEELLQRVLAEAPGSPWAVLAARELKDPFGMRIEERFIPPPKPRPASKAKPTKPRIRFEPENRRPTKPAAKPKRPVLPKL